MRRLEPDLRRHALAFAAAPVVAALTWAVTALVWLAWIDGLEAARNNLRSLLVGTPLIGFPVAVALVLFIAGPVYAIVEAKSTLTRAKVLAAGVMIGVITPAAARSLVEGISLINGVNGAIIGLTTAWVWWIVAEGAPRRPSSPPHLG